MWHVPMRDMSAQDPESTDDPRSSAPAMIAGRYEVKRVLGRGGFGVVYESFDQLEQRDVALKVIRTGALSALGSRIESRMESVMRTSSREPKTVQSVGTQRSRMTQVFKDEFRLLTQLHHANLAAVYDFGYSDEVKGVYFTQELVPGIPLDRFLRDADRPRIVDVFVQLARALDHIHALGLVHEDIKPSNVLVAEHGGHPRAKLIDFGLARMLRVGEGEQPDDGAGLLGTPGFSAPEKVAGQSTDARSDIYSLAATMYAAVQGRGPFPVKSFAEALASQNEWTRERAAILRARVGPVVEDLVGRMLDPNPERRPQSARSVVLELLRREDVHPARQNDESDRRELARVLVEHLPFVDRAHYLERMLERVGKIAAGLEPEDPNQKLVRTVVVHAAEGMGKQRLMAELRREVQLVDVLYTEGSCWSSDPSELGVFGPVILQLSTALGANSPVMRQYGDVVKAARKRAPGRLTGGRLIEFMLACAAERPFVLHVAELSQAQEGTRQLFDELVRAVDHNRVPIFIAVSATPHTKVAGMLGRLAHDRIVDLWTLGSLTRHELANLLEAVFGRGPVVPELVALLDKLTAGHPMGVREGLRVLIEESILVRDADTWTLRGSTDDSAELGETLARRTESRLDSVGVGAWELAATLYLVGAPIEQEQLSALADLRRDRFNRLLERLEGEGLITRTAGSGAGQITLAHESAREAVRRRYEQSLDETRLDLAERIEELGTKDASLLYLRAKLLDDASEGVESLDALEEIAGRLLDRGQPQLGAKLLDRVIRRLRRHGGVEGLPRLLSATLTLLSRGLGALEDQEREAAHWRAGILVAELVGDHRAQALFWLGLIDRFATATDQDLELSLSRLTRAAEAADLSEDQVLQLRIANRRAELLISAGLIDRAKTFSEKAMAILDVEGAADADVCNIVGVRMRCLVFAGQLGEARKLHEFCMPIAARVPVTQRQAYLSGLAFLGLLGGDPAAALPELEQAIEDINKAGLHRLLLTPVHNVGDLRLRIGNLEGAMESFREALRLATLLGNTYHVHLNRGFLGYTMARMGNVEEGAPLLSRAKRDLQVVVGEHIALHQLQLLDAEVAHLLGHSAHARRQLEEMLARFFSANELAMANWAQDALARIERELGTNFIAAAPEEEAEDAAPDMQTVRTRPLE